MGAFTIPDSLDHLDAESKHLVHKAKDAIAAADAPCSKFLVGVALLLEDGKIITGTNQENAALPSGMCGERVAFYSAASLQPGKTIVKLAVVAKRKHGRETSSCHPMRGHVARYCSSWRKDNKRRYRP